MKKLVFGLIAMVMTVLSSSANNPSVCTSDSDLLNSKDGFHLNSIVENRCNEDDFLRPKNGWYYAGVDAGGGYAGFQAGAATGHPLLMSAGMVFGAIGTSAWEWYWNHKSAPIKVNNPKDAFAGTFTNLSEQGGYIHNSFIVKFINENQVTFESAEEFVNKIYNPLCIEISNVYKIDLETVKETFTKANMVKELNAFNELHSTDDDNERISILGKIVEETTQNSTFSEHYTTVMSSFRTEETKLDFKIETFVNNEISKLQHDDKYTAEEKTVMVNSLNILKYSYSLWSNN